MYVLSFIRQTTDVYRSFNQSAITSTGTTVPLYFNKHQQSYTKKKNRTGKKIYQATVSKRQYPFESEHVDHNRSMESLTLDNIEEPTNRSPDRNVVLSFNQITKSKRRKVCLHRLFFTCICLLVLILVMIITIVLILQSS